MTQAETMLFLAGVALGVFVGATVLGADSREREPAVAAAAQFGCFHDPVGGLWHTAWDLVDMGDMQRECELHDSWDTSVGQPQHDQGIAIMEHDGLPACADPATATPTS